MHIRRDSLDDLLNDVLTSLLTSGLRETASNGSFLEHVGVLLELTHPRARLSRSGAKGHVFSSLGEFLWCVSGSDESAFVRHYVPQYPFRKGDEEHVLGAYGPRIFGLGIKGQIDNIVKLLSIKPTSRKGVVSIYTAEDLARAATAATEGVEPREVPCTCSLQFLIRKERLDLVAHLRSSDAYVGLPHDVFCFTMLQELVAARLQVQLGRYLHSVGSLHLYEDDIAAARFLLQEGWQQPSTMPVMPAEQVVECLDGLLEIERAVRVHGRSPAEFQPLPPYWSDLAWLAYAHKKFGRQHGPFELGISEFESRISHPIYKHYLLDRAERLQARESTPDFGFQ